jgi:hypothetical protein
MSTKGYYYLVLHGHLKAELDDGVIQWRFAEDAEAGAEPKVHPINHGDMLKVFDREQTLVWSGVVAYNLSMCSEPHPENPDVMLQKIGDKIVNGIQGSARPKDWLQWFEHGARARLEIRINGENEPAEAPPQGADESGEASDPDVLRAKLIAGVLQAHDASSASKPGAPRSGDGVKHWWDD